MNKFGSKIKDTLEALFVWLFDKPLHAPTCEQMNLVQNLRTSFINLRILDTEDLPPSQAFWSNKLNRLRELVIEDNPRQFLRWDVVREVMFVAYARCVIRELYYIRRQRDWSTRWRPVLQESEIGWPLRYPLFPSSSGNLIHHAYHVAQFQKSTDRYVAAFPFILEFGGGYGSLCRVIYNMGFAGKYIIFDLPHFSLLQEFFLNCLKIPVHSFEKFPAATNGVCCISDLDELKTLLSLYAGVSDKLLVATWSLSETPLKLRDRIQPLLKDFTAFLIAYQHTFGEVDNVDYFRRFSETVSNHMDWQTWPIEHIPGNYYLIGDKTAV